ncbi:acyltransferase family protein [Cronobacter malonaticus]
MAETRFRYDINALRALAVLSVVLFHFAPDLVPGGFVGVDIFFVISGCLMTSIIVRGNEKGNFSILGFYASRCKRIIPALSVMISLVLALGYLTIVPHDFQKLGLHSRDSLFFISNITYFFESGYFDVDSLEKFLLHTWSLSVEWQFYLIYPLIISVIYFLGKQKSLALAITTLFISSFIVSVVITKKSPSQAYFMIYTRAWEMLAGGLAFIFQLKIIGRWRSLLLFASIASIAICVFAFDSKTPWPGYGALVPVISTAIIISLSPPKSHLHCNPVIQKLGLWSYSIYLYHWPVIVFAKKFDHDLSFASFAAITMSLSLISYYLVERTRFNAIFILSFTFLVACIAHLLSLDGAAYRASNLLKVKAENYNELYNPWIMYRGLQKSPFKINVSSVKKAQYILAGDSFALMYVEAMKRQGRSFEVIAYESCNTTSINSSYASSEACLKMKDEFVKRASQDDGLPVLISQSWDIYLSGLTKDQASIQVGRYIERISNINNNRQFYILGSYHQPSFNPYTCLTSNEELKRNFATDFFLKRKCEDLENRNKDLSHIKYNLDDIFENAVKGHKNIHFIPTKEFQCSGDSCRIIYKGEPIIIRPHLTLFGADMFSKEELKVMGIH